MTPPGKREDPRESKNGGWVKPCGQKAGGLRSLYPEVGGRQRSSEEQVKVWTACKGR